jgi:hypothetical protein
MNIEVGNKFLTQEGLVSLRDVWIKVHYGGPALRDEPLIAEPHDGWCGGWRVETSGYPIMAYQHLMGIRLSLHCQGSIFQIKSSSDTVPKSI